jgi:peptidoglycan hydrolase-like protein with peptidoglycan-binding domain
MGTNLTVDGEYGENTKDAVVAFQKKYSLSVDGEFGKNSLAKAKTIKK